MKTGKEAFYRQLEMGLDDAHAYTSKVMTENMLAAEAKKASVRSSKTQTGMAGVKAIPPPLG